MSDELLPCPFCGFKAKLFSSYWEGADVYSYWIECTNRDCLLPEMSTQEFDTQKQVTEAWNTRS